MDKQAQLTVIRQYREDLRLLEDEDIFKILDDFLSYTRSVFYEKVRKAPHLLKNENEMQYQECLRSFGMLTSFGFICQFEDLNGDIQNLIDFHEKKAFNKFLQTSYESIKSDLTPDRSMYYLNEIEFDTKISLQSIEEDENIPEIIIHKLKKTLLFTADSKEYLRTKIQFPVTVPLQISANHEVDHLRLKNGLDLWDLFLDPAKADLIKQKLISSERLIIKGNSKIHFMPTRANSKYEVESLRQALNFNQLLNTKIELLQSDIIDVFKNTFDGFECDVRTLNSKSISKKVNYYMALCKLD